MTGLGYTAPAVLAVLAVCALEFTASRTGLFRLPGLLGRHGHRGWISNPGGRLGDQAQRADRRHDDRQTTGIRFPFDIPVEDFLFGFALVTAVLLLWEGQRERR